MALTPHPDTAYTLVRPKRGQTNNSSHAKCTKYPVIEPGVIEWKRTLKCASEWVFAQCFVLPCVWEMNKQLHSLPWQEIKYISPWYIFFFPERLDGCFPPPSGKENNAHLLHHVWSTDTYGRQQAGTLLMHCLRSHLSGSYCCLMTGSAGSIFSGFRLVPRRAVNLPEPAAGGIRLPLPPLVREAGGEDKDGEGLKKGKKIDFAFEYGGVLPRRQRCQQLFLHPEKIKIKK